MILRLSYLALLLGLLAGCAQTGVLTREHPQGADANYEALRAAIAGGGPSYDVERVRVIQTNLDRLDAYGGVYAERAALLRGRLDVVMARATRRTSTPHPEEFVNSIGITMRLIRPGSFLMGTDSEIRPTETPVTQVTISRPFYIGAYEVTFGQYARIMGEESTATNAPLNNVSWDDAMNFCKLLSEREGIRYTLPTEAQWEYACRAGTYTAFWFGEIWSEARSREPNSWGLYDMHGNYGEWCADWYQDSLFGGSLTDPTGPLAGSHRVVRGGSWDTLADGCRSASRHKFSPTTRHESIGFRVVALP